jgi:hypothetical protein
MGGNPSACQPSTQSNTRTAPHQPKPALPKRPKQSYRSCMHTHTKRKSHPAINSCPPPISDRCAALECDFNRFCTPLHTCNTASRLMLPQRTDRHAASQPKPHVIRKMHPCRQPSGDCCLQTGPPADHPQIQIQVLPHITARLAGGDSSHTTRGPSNQGDVPQE